MRLIDADKLMPNAKYKGQYDSVSARDIVNTPTVEAIPVEWIKKRMEHWAEYGNQYITIMEMLEDWEKENETNRCR